MSHPDELPEVGDQRKRDLFAPVQWGLLFLMLVSFIGYGLGHLEKFAFLAQWVPHAH